jgi:hypothetical protein
MSRVSNSLAMFALCCPLPAAAGGGEDKVEFPVDRELMAQVVDADFVAMRTKIDALVAETSAHFKCGTEHLEARSGQRTYVRAEPGETQGDVVELTTGEIPVSLEDFLISIPAAEWGQNLAHLEGRGEVIPLPALGPGRQIERMVLRAPLKAQHMTKIEEIVEERSPDGTLRRVTVYWEVIDSANDTVIRDVGYVRFARGGPQRTLVTTHSGHRFGGFPFSSRWVSDAIKQKAAAWSLASYFSDHGARYCRLAVLRTAQRGLADRLRRATGD